MSIPNEASKFWEWLLEHDADRDLLEFSLGRTPRQFWNECPRGTWLLWMLLEDQRAWPDNIEYAASRVSSDLLFADVVRATVKF